MWFNVLHLCYFPLLGVLLAYKSWKQLEKMSIKIRNTFAESSKEEKYEESCLRGSYSHNGHLSHKPIVQWRKRRPLGLVGALGGNRRGGSSGCALLLCALLFTLLRISHGDHPITAPGVFSTSAIGNATVDWKNLCLSPARPERIATGKGSLRMP